mgnify:CR=1 FL=1
MGVASVGEVISRHGSLPASESSAGASPATQVGGKSFASVGASAASSSGVGGARLVRSAWIGLPQMMPSWPKVSAEAAAPSDSSWLAEGRRDEEAE